MDWQWAEDVLQQLLKSAMNARLMRALPGGCVPAAAAAAFAQAFGSSGILSPVWLSSHGISPSIVDAERLICASVTASAGSLFVAAQRQRDATRGGREQMVEYFASQPAVAEVALQLLAVRCLLMHKQLALWQQQQQQQQQQGLALRQQGRRMRRDGLLLLPSDLQQHLAQLLPSEAMIAAVDVIAAKFMSGSTSTAMPAAGSGLTQSDMAAGEQHVLKEVTTLAAMLHMHVTSIAAYKRDGSISSPASSAAALQLSAVLLLLAAAEWQRQWCALTVQQQELLKADAAALDEPAAVVEADRVRQQLAPVSALLTLSCQLLQQQTAVLLDDGQWQPQLQLLQQGGGEVLLQGLMLALHCVVADSKLRNNIYLQYFKLLEVLLPRLGA
jgi:hypothetical protein